MGVGFLPNQVFTDISTDVLLEISVDTDEPLPWLQRQLQELRGAVYWSQHFTVFQESEASLICSL